MHILHAIAQNKKTPIIVVAGSSHTNHIAKRLQQCGYTVTKSIGKNPEKGPSVGSQLFPSAVNFKTVFSNLEQVGCIRKINNFFRHSWKKIITAFYQNF